MYPKAKIYGQDLFRSKGINYYDKSMDANAPDNYELGPGDELNIAVWGRSDYSSICKIDPRGYIDLKGFGRVYVKGLTLEKAKSLIRSRLNMSKSSMDITLVYSRVILVNIVGEVKNPGTYSMSALNNAFHALAAAGGPTEIGSIRNVKVYRSGNVFETIDFYKFFINPEGFKIAFLQDGDFLIVPAIMNLISTSGSFKREMNFEILPNETLQNLADLSGGFSGNSYDKKIKIFRKTDQEKIIIDVESKDFSAINLFDGDSVYAGFKDVDLDKYVNISGAFAQPGNYGYIDDMTLGDLISLAGGVVGRFPDKEVLLSRLQEDGNYKIFRIPLDEKISSFKLRVSDYISLSSREQDLELRKIKIIGAVSNPGNYKYSVGMTLDDALKISGGILEGADNERIEITRRKIELNKSGFLELTYSSLYVSIDSSMVGSWYQEYDKSNIILRPYDIINIRTVKNYELQNSVYVSGEVKFPGYYPILKSDEKISDVVKRAGGISEIGDAFNAQVFRENDSNLVFRLDMALLQDKFNYLLQANDNI